VSAADSAQLTGLLLRQPRLCVSCAAAKLAFTQTQISTAVEYLVNKGVMAPRAEPLSRLWSGPAGPFARALNGT
jgi:hypothetical protein